MPERPSTDPTTPTGRKELGTTYYVLGWLMLLVALLLVLLVPAETRAGRWELQALTYGIAAVGAILVLVGRARRTRAKKELNV